MSKNQKKKKIWDVKLLIFLVLITTIIVVNLSISKFINQKNAMKSARVALMGNDVYVTFDDVVVGHPGITSDVYELELTNKDDRDNVCDVSQQFSISIEGLDERNIPVEYSIYKDKNCTELISPDSNGMYCSDDFKFEASKEDNQKFYLKIKWSKDKKNAAYAFEIEYFVIHIIVDQID